MSVERTFQLVDVFSEGPFLGNPVAVVSGADALGTEEMLRITRWLNLSETTFLLPPTRSDADYRVRIFTLEREMPFAGHPTLGTCHAWLRAGGHPREESKVVQECGAGLVVVRRRGGLLAFAAPPLVRSGPVAEQTLAEIVDVLGIHRSKVVDASWADNGPGWIAILLESAKAVLDIEPARSHPRRFDVGVVGAYEKGAMSNFELRAFFTDHLGTIREDPVTGSLNASVAQWLLRSGRARTPYVATQGCRVGHAGRIEIDSDPDGPVWVGGRTQTMFEGSAPF